MNFRMSELSPLPADDCSSLVTKTVSVKFALVNLLVVSSELLCVEPGVFVLKLSCDDEGPVSDNFALLSGFCRHLLLSFSVLDLSFLSFSGVL